MEGPLFSFLFQLSYLVMLANLAFFLFFGDDGHFGDITKLAIKDQKKRKGKKTTATTT